MSLDQVTVTATLLDVEPDCGEFREINGRYYDFRLIVDGILSTVRRIRVLDIVQESICFSTCKGLFPLKISYVFPISQIPNYVENDFPDVYDTHNDEFRVLDEVGYEKFY